MQHVSRTTEAAKLEKTLWLRLLNAYTVAASKPDISEHELFALHRIVHRASVPAARFVNISLACFSSGKEVSR